MSLPCLAAAALISQYLPTPCLVGCQIRALQSLADSPGRDFEPEGPAGPTAYWKITDEVDDDKSRHDQLLAAQYSGLDSSDDDDAVHEDDDSEDDDEDFDPETSNMVFLTSSD